MKYSKTVVKLSAFNKLRLHLFFTREFTPAPLFPEGKTGFPVIAGFTPVERGEHHERKS